MRLTCVYICVYNYIYGHRNLGKNLRPWVPRLYLKLSMTLRSKLKLSSEGVTIKKVDPKTGKKSVSIPQPFHMLKKKTAS